jgi:hypothetical protein
MDGHTTEGVSTAPLVLAAAALHFSATSKWYPSHLSEKLQTQFSLALRDRVGGPGLGVAAVAAGAAAAVGKRSTLNTALRASPGLLALLDACWVREALLGDREPTVEELLVLEKLGQHQAPLPSPPTERNRILTILPYLSHVEEGGETVFPDAEEPGYFGPNTLVRPGMEACSEGAFVPPKKGSAALFYHLLGNGLRDSKCTHGGCPPLKGDKYAINMFCWNHEVGAGLKYYT